MRYGILADVHGNLHALRAAVATLRADGVERFLCAGDLVGYGPFPNECVETVAGLDALCVAGNHDLIALGRLSDERCIPLARTSLDWTRRRLSQEAREYLEALPARVELDGVVMAHGSLDDPQHYVRDGTDAAEQLSRLAAGWPLARVLILGHTHVARAWGPRGQPLEARRGAVMGLATDGPTLLNPGAVGQSRERRIYARSLALDPERQQAIFHADEYDVSACRRALRRAGLSTEAPQLSPTRRGRAVRKLRRLAALASPQTPSRPAEGSDAPGVPRSG